jgi:uncharacterized phage-like protein YoqJ
MKGDQMFKVIIAGGRDFSDYDLLKEKATQILQKYIETNQEIIIISGTARGVDQLGEQYAKEMGFKIKRYAADWDKFGKSAGYKRNQKMAEVADAAIVFWDGQSKGSKHMIDIAKNKGLKVRVVNYD